MTALKVGDRIKDNDPRTTERVLVVERFLNDTRALCYRDGWTAYPVRVRLDRIHNDGKPRKRGFSVLP